MSCDAHAMTGRKGKGRFIKVIPDSLKMLQSALDQGPVCFSYLSNAREQKSGESGGETVKKWDTALDQEKENI